MQARRTRVPIYYNVFIVILHGTGSRVVYYRRMRRGITIGTTTYTIIIRESQIVIYHVV